MISILDIKEKGFPAVSFIASVVIHFIISFAIIFILDITMNESAVPPTYVQIITSETEKNLENIINEEENKSAEKFEKFEEEKIEEKPLEKKISEGNVFFSVDKNSDTTSLNQIYKENTLDVEVKYPSGWTYIDQNVKSKLDGVTFWSVKGNYSPPPYIHLEVKEKYLFNAERFKYTEKIKNFTVYFNDPEELEGQVSQTLYIRTDTDEDYSFKLIMNGKKSFESFQPIFFGMVKTFKFNNSFF